MVVVGNKAEAGLEEKAVASYEAQRLGFPFFEVSAKNGDGVNSAFHVLAELALGL